MTFAYLSGLNTTEHVYHIVVESPLVSIMAETKRRARKRTMAEEEEEAQRSKDAKGCRRSSRRTNVRAVGHRVTCLPIHQLTFSVEKVHCYVAVSSIESTLLAATPLARQETQTSA